MLLFYSCFGDGKVLVCFNSNVILVVWVVINVVVKKYVVCLLIKWVSKILSRIVMLIFIFRLMIVFKSNNVLLLLCDNLEIK